jgi:hypothetical protein
MPAGFVNILTSDRWRVQRLLEPEAPSRSGHRQLRSFDDGRGKCAVKREFTTGGLGQINPTWITPVLEAVGYKYNKKGRCSCRPLYCTFAQTGRLFDVSHRAGSVHDFNAARSFSRARIERKRTIAQNVIIGAIPGSCSPTRTWRPSRPVHDTTATTIRRHYQVLNRRASTCPFGCYS